VTLGKQGTSKKLGIKRVVILSFKVPLTDRERTTKTTKPFPKENINWGRQKNYTLTRARGNKPKQPEFTLWCGGEKRCRQTKKTPRHRGRGGPHRLVPKKPQPQPVYGDDPIETWKKEGQGPQDERNSGPKGALEKKKVIKF